MGTRIGARRYNFDWRSFITPGVKLLVLVCSGVFLLQTLLGLLAPPAATIWLLKWFALIPEAVTHHIPPRIWQPLTYIFLHGGLLHLLINMLMLWMFGRELELVWGKRKFLNYFCICGVGAGLIEGEAQVSELFLHLWSGRGTHRAFRQNDSSFLWKLAFGNPHDRCIRRYFRHSHGQRCALP